MILGIILVTILFILWCMLKVSSMCTTKEEKNNRN